MATNPLTSATLASNPTLDAHPERYSFADGNNVNRTVGQLRCFLPWMKIDGQFLEVRGHDPTTPLSAEFYNHAAAATTPVPVAAGASNPYVFATPAVGAATVQLSL